MTYQTAIYDDISTQYRDSKRLGFRDAIEAETLRQIQGDLSDLCVIDLACGEGHYTRRLRRAGARSVLGVDISSEMIQLAEAAEAITLIGCDYAIADVADFQPEQPADLAVAMYLLNYAYSAEQLQAFVDAVFAMLKPGGRFVGFNDNPNSDPTAHGSMFAYGFERTSALLRIEGNAVVYEITNPDGTQFRFCNFYLSDETYRAAFAKAGFVDFRWEGPFLKESERFNEHWHHFMRHAPMVGFSAAKPEL